MQVLLRGLPAHLDASWVPDWQRLGVASTPWLPQHAPQQSLLRLPPAQLLALTISFLQKPAAAGQSLLRGLPAQMLVCSWPICLLLLRNRMQLL